MTQDFISTHGLSPVKSFPAHRCEPVYLGRETRTDARRYSWDNRQRETFSLFQYTLSGEGLFRAGPRERVVRPGEAFLVNVPGDTGYRLAPGREWSFIYILFVGDMARHHVATLLERHGPVLAMPPAAPPVEILQRLHRECSAGVTHDPHALSATLYRFLMELYRVLDPRDDIPACVGRAIRRIERDYRDPALRLADLARDAGLSLYHFARLFRRHTGVSPYAYLLRVRMSEALDHLLSTPLSVKEISRMMGFNEVSHFCRVFRQHHGRSPGRARGAR
jgi:AraC-like DNA-binding protein